MKLIPILALTLMVGVIGCDRRDQERSTDSTRGYVSQSEILKRSQESRTPARTIEKTEKSGPQKFHKTETHRKTDEGSGGAPSETGVEPKFREDRIDNTASESDHIEFESYRGIGE